MPPMAPVHLIGLNSQSGLAAVQSATETNPPVVDQHEDSDDASCRQASSGSNATTEADDDTVVSPLPSSMKS